MKETLVMRTDPIDGAPSEIQVIPFGRHETAGGDFILDPDGMREIIAEFDSRRNDMVIDYEHQTLGGSEAPAAGWIRRLIDRGSDGLWAAVEWTPRAVGYLANREYRYLSPVFMKRISNGRAVRLINAALTNQPAIDGMVPVVNRAAVNPQKEGGGKKMEKVLEALGLDKVAGEQEALDAIASLRSRLSSVLDALGIGQEATDAEASGTAAAMKQAHEQLPAIAAKVAELEGTLGNKEASGLIEQAMSEGKLTPAQKSWATDYAGRDLEGFRVFVAKAPVIVPLAAAPAGGALRSGIAPDETQRKVNAHLGISAEAFSHYGK